MESLVRLGVFLGIFTAMVLWEFLRPRRPLSRPRRERWVTNLGITFLDMALVRITVGAAAYAAAVFAAEQGVGVLHWMTLPPWAAAALTLVALDFAIYLQHVMFHAVPALWRLHRVHHADLGFDATTGLRFHPIEIFLSLGFKMAVVVLLGAVPWAVIAFEIILNASSVFNHGNVAIPEPIDHWLRWAIVTPDMHRIHHSTRVVETNSNFGFSLSWWDRLCGTYRAQPALGQMRMEVGLSEYRTSLNLGALLLLPFQRNAGHYTVAGARSVNAERRKHHMKTYLPRIGLFVFLVISVALAWLNLIRKGLLALALLAAVALLSSLIRRWRGPGKMSPQQLQALLSQGEAPLVLDVRNRDEFVGERSHIQEAVLVPLAELDRRLSELEPHRTRTVVPV